MERDYSKFLDENGRLRAFLIPIKDFRAMVKVYRDREEVIREVFGGLYWLWDLEQLEAKAKEDDDDVDIAELSREVQGMMDDEEWWQCMSAFELHFIEHFTDDVSQWTDYLDPVYDAQERDGWVERR